MDARGLSIEMMVKGSEQSTMDELAELSMDAEKIFTF